MANLATHLNIDLIYQKNLHLKLPFFAIVISRFKYFLSKAVSLHSNISNKMKITLVYCCDKKLFLNTPYLCINRYFLIACLKFTFIVLRTF